jgi:hypothetical protein
MARILDEIAGTGIAVSAAGIGEIGTAEIETEVTEAVSEGLVDRQVVSAADSEAGRQVVSAADSVVAPLDLVVGLRVLVDPREDPAVDQ